MGERPSPEHSIDRIDNNGGYGKDNCRWANKRQQCTNKRTTRLLTYNGETLCIADWARKLGINSRTIRARLLRGWSAEQALSSETPYENGFGKVLKVSAIPPLS